MKENNLTLEQMHAQLDPAGLPRHIAVIMDGNGRWALRKGMPRIAGHKKGVETARRIIERCKMLEIEVLTLYAFSDENWGRPRKEVDFLMGILETFLKKEIAAMKANDIRFQTIGRLEKLPASARQWVERAIAETAGSRGMVLNVALSYGGRGEIIEAIKKLLSANVPAESITEELYGSYLDTAGLPDPDLIIRTSGEKRISNFLLWQAAYAEFYFTETLWPDFEERDLLLAILDYQGRQRRFGLTQEQIEQEPDSRPDTETEDITPPRRF